MMPTSPSFLTNGLFFNQQRYKSLGYCIGLAEDQVVKDAQVGTLRFCWAFFGGEELRHEFLAPDFVFFPTPGFLKHRF